MKHFSAILRIALIIIGIRILYLNDFTFGNIESCTGIALIIIAIYFAIISRFGIEAVMCPMCNGGECKIKKKKKKK